MCAFAVDRIGLIPIPISIGEGFIIDPMPRAVSTNFPQSNPSIRIVKRVIGRIYSIYIVPFIKIFRFNFDYSFVVFAWK